MSVGVALGALAASLALAAPLSAQPLQPGEDADARSGDIVVTASRIDTAGFEAPTPTTVITEAELRQAGRTDIQASLADLPQIRLTSSATSTNSVTNSGVSPGDLRGLGASRTLVLVNGRRSVSSGDLQTVPYGLVSQINVVTGGASAAWGSGAVAGVINIVLDDRLQGLNVGAQYGISDRGDGAKRLFNAAFGTNITDRWHVMIGADYLDDDGVSPAVTRPRIGATAFFPGTDGRLYPTQDIRQADRSVGGLIIGGPLAGFTFNDNGSIRPFQFGRRSGSLMAGGEGYNGDLVRSLSAPIERANVFGRTSYEITDTLKIWAEAGYNNVSDARIFFPDLAISQTQFSYSIDNPFLDPAVRARLAAAGATSFNMTRVVSDIALNTYDYERETRQFSVGFDGTFGGGLWRYGAFYTNGYQSQDQNLLGIIKTAEFRNAIDAVRNPAGQIVCRIALTNPNTPCRPLNLFGQGNADPAAVDYVNDDWGLFNETWLDNFGASISGEPFRLWDKPVSVAAGVEYREESFKATYDAVSNAGRFATINGTDIPRRGNNVKEGFAEIAVPLLANLPFAQDVTFNGAARVSKYSTFGDNIWSWKVGGTWQVIDDIKFRATRSRDIRAPSLTELFSNPGTLFQTVTDISKTPSEAAQVVLRTGGNPNLAPEIADTLTVGVVLTPTFLRGLNFSVDYYDIKIDDVISTLSAQQIINSCVQQNNQGACAQLTRNAAGTLTDINATFINVASYANKGIDFELSYRTRLENVGIPGTLGFRGLVNYVDTLTVDNGVVLTEGAGFAGSQAAFLTPKWRANTALVYEGPDMGADIRMRWINKSKFVPTTVLANVGGNDIDARAYFDLGLRGYIPFGSDNGRLTIYGSVQNLFDQKPPIGAVSSPYYDLIGRYFTVGASMRF